MKQFMMLFHEPAGRPMPDSPEEMQAMVKVWQDWIGGIAAQDKFVSSEALGFEGKTLEHGGLVTDGPYAEVKEIVGGYLICHAENLEEAAKLAEGCPILAFPGGKVEIRDVMVFDM